jgi:predicted N-acyltransferase
MLTIEEKEKELNGKRYKIITMGIEKQRADGGEVSHEMEIDLHWCWMETIRQIKSDLHRKD